jgi:hypothetical protein
LLREVERLREYEQAHIASIYRPLPVTYLAPLGDVIYLATYGLKRSSGAETVEAVMHSDRFGNTDHLEATPLAAARASYTKARTLYHESSPPGGDARFQRLLDVEVAHLKRRGRNLSGLVRSAVDGDDAADDFRGVA